MVKSIPSRKKLLLKLHRYSTLRKLLSLYKEKQSSKTLSFSTTKTKQTKNNHLLTPIKEHFYTFQQFPDLFTLLFTSTVFGWINKERLLIICDNPKTGYQIEIFLHSFNYNSTFLDKEMPLNTNNHFYNSFLKGNIPICIVNSSYAENSPNYAKEIVNNTPIPISIIYFDCTDSRLLEFHSYHINTRAIYHFISNKELFISNYDTLDEKISFREFEFDSEQMAHLRYRCENIYSGIRKSDIKKEKARKINLELLHSKKMEAYFQKNPQEKLNVIKAIEENTIKTGRSSIGYIPSYLIHQENNPIANAIRSNYSEKGVGKRNRRRNKKKKMEEYLEALDRGDGSHELVKF